MKRISINALRKHLCLLLLFVIISSMFGGCGKTALFPKSGLKPSWFIQICITDANGNASTFTDENEIKHYIEAINTAEGMENDISSGALAEYRLTLEGKKLKHSREFTLYLDDNLENRNLFIGTESELRKIGDAYFSDLLAEPVFEPIYPHRAPPQITLQYDSTNYKLEPGSYQWKFRKSDMNYSVAESEQPGNNGNIGLKVSDATLPTILTEHEPDRVKWAFNQGDEAILTLEEGQSDTLKLEDGTYHCLLELQWLENKNRGFYGTVFYDFDIQIDNPPEIRISSLETYPGELLVITANHVNQDEEVTITTDIDFKPNVFGEGSKRVVLLPVSYFHKVNRTYFVDVTVGVNSEKFEVKVLDKDFITQYMTIDTKVAAATRNDDSAREVADKIAPLRPVCDEEQYWEGAFIQPVEGGRVSPTDFGKRRYVNNAPTSYRHNGLDIGQDEGTPIKAINHGRVLLADYLIGTGYTIIIEHGYGLKSWYYHMVSLNVETGDMVQKGDIIGLVGSTGFSTGPHLHLSISVNHVYVNPMPFFETGVPLVNQNGK